MTTINQLRSRMAALNVKEESFKAVTATKETITALQKQQMLQGLDGQGKKIGRYSNRKYAVYKNELNPLPGLGVPDLKLTGAFYEGFTTDVTPDAFTTSSTDTKNAMLTERYDPFGLDADSKSIYAKELRPVFVRGIKEKLQL